MNKNKELLVAILLTIIIATILYLVGVFCSSNFNISNWSWILRGILFIIFILFVIRLIQTWEA